MRKKKPVRKTGFCRIGGGGGYGQVRNYQVFFKDFSQKVGTKHPITCAPISKNHSCVQSHSSVNLSTKNRVLFFAENWNLKVAISAIFVAPEILKIQTYTKYRICLKSRRLFELLKSSTVEVPTYRGIHEKSSGRRDSCLLHYLHYLSIPLHTHS